MSENYPEGMHKSSKVKKFAAAIGLLKLSTFKTF